MVDAEPERAGETGAVTVGGCPRRWAPGTPSWVIGDRVLEGAVGYEGLAQALAEARGS